MRFNLKILPENFRPLLLVPCLLLVLLLLDHSFMLVTVQGASMSPTLQDGQRVLIRRGKDSIEPGDIALFISPINNKLSIKRCVLTNKDIPVIAHGWLQTPWGSWYVDDKTWQTLEQNNPGRSDSFFMVGDNQFNSLDSRSYGFVDRSRILGRLVSGKQK